MWSAFMDGCFLALFGVYAAVSLLSVGCWAWYSIFPPSASIHPRKRTREQPGKRHFAAFGPYRGILNLPVPREPLTFFACPDAYLAPHGRTDMAAYLIADIMIDDPDTYDEYVRQVSRIIVNHGGSYLARGGRVVPLSRDWHPERVIVISFPSLEAARRCFDSEEYRQIAPIREASATSRAILVDAVVPSECGTPR